jgi:hypothetical protein
MGERAVHKVGEAECPIAVEKPMNSRIRVVEIAG